MAYTMRLQKVAKRRLDEKSVEANIKRIVSRALAGSRGHQGWKCKGYSNAAALQPVIQNGDYTYSIGLEFHKSKSSGKDIDEQQFDKLAEIATTAANSAGRWQIVEINGEQIDHNPTQKETSFIEPKSIDLNGHFKDIYDREAQIEIIHSSIKAFLDSQKNNRFHSVLFGPPGCGKTDILLKFVNMLGEDAVLKFDATSTTKAGAERFLLEADQVPPFLIVEEIEKTDEQSLRWLLGILDHRAEIRKVNFKGSQHRHVRLLCLATVNDIDLFNKVMSGALASRFSNKIYCPRPSYAVLFQILKREVTKVNGNMAWVPPTLEYCEARGINDPRQVITICLCGRDKLLDGRYQGYLDATCAPK